MKNAILLSIAIVLLLSCEGPEGPAGPAGPAGAPGPAGATGSAGASGVLTGDLIGLAYLFDEFTNEIEDKSGVTVTLEGTSPLKTATTNAAGSFTFTGLPSGVYKIVATKTGFGTYRDDVLSFVGGTNPTATSVALAAISTTVINSFGATPSLPYFDLTGTITPAGTSLITRYVTVFIGKTNTVSSSNYDTWSYINTNSANLNGTIYLGNNYSSGQKVYLIAYGGYPYTGSYYNPFTGKTIFPQLNATPSLVLEVTIP